MSSLACVGLVGVLLGAPPADAIDVEVEVDAPGRRLRLGRLDVPVAFPSIDVEGRDDRIRVHLDAPGPPATKWRLEVEEWDAHGRRVRTLRALERQGRGPPPLYADFAPDRPPVGAYVAWLEVERGPRDRARSAVAVLPTPGASRRARDRVLAVVPAEKVPAGLSGLGPSLQDALRYPRARVQVRGHWTPGDDAVPASRALASRAVAALAEALRAEVAASGGDRLEPVARGASEPRFPTLSPRLAARNRRVEVVRVVDPVPPPRGTRAPPRPPRSLILTIDGKTATVPLTDAPRRALSLDLRPPAQVQAVLHDGFGARLELRRIADRAGMVAAKIPAPQTATAALAGPVRVRGGAHRLTPQGRRLEVEIAAPDTTTRWRLEARLAAPMTAPASGGSVVVVAQAPVPRYGETGTARGADALVCVRSGEGPPPPRVSLDVDEPRTRTTPVRVRLVIEGAEGARRAGEPWTADPLDLEPWVGWVEPEAPLEVALAEPLEQLAARPSAALRFVVDGGGPASRRALRRRLARWADQAGLGPERWTIDAGQARGDLTVRAILEAEAPLQPPTVAPPGRGGVSEAG